MLVTEVNTLFAFARTIRYWRQSGSSCACGEVK